MKLKQENKKQIAGAIQAYSEQKEISLNEIGRRSGVNPAYVSQIVNEKGDVKDKWYSQLADFIGWKLEKTYWSTVETPQFVEIITHLDDARRDGRNRMIIGETGCGKTYAIDKYILANPQGTFKVTISDLHNLGDIINEMCDVTGAPSVGARVTKLKNISNRLKWLQNEGKQPLLIIDEAENMKIHALRMLKSLYDRLKGVCPIVLIGTSQLVKKVDRLRKKDREGIPQFYRRFKAGMRYLPAVDMTFKQFLNDIEDRNLIKLLKEICTNYGELNDYLEFALKEADSIGEPLDEKLFCEIYNIRKEDVYV